MNELTHINNKVDAQMVDVSAKESTTRSAKVLMQAQTLQKIKTTS